MTYFKRDKDEEDKKLLFFYLQIANARTLCSKTLIELRSTNNLNNLKNQIDYTDLPISKNIFVKKVEFKKKSISHQIVIFLIAKDPLSTIFSLRNYF